MCIEWKPVIVEHRTVDPYVKIYKNQLIISSGIHSIIDDIYDYNFVTISIGKENGVVTKIAFTFLKNYESNSIKVHRPKGSKRLAINSKFLVDQYISFSSSASGKTVYPKYPIFKSGSHKIVIDLANPINDN